MSETNSTTRSLQGRVVSNKMNHTVTVLIERQIQHGVYGKILRRSTKLHAHDESGDCREGDLVRIIECRPLSKTKHHRVVEVLQRAGE
jgi:small subunit ribosomal protein S17